MKYTYKIVETPLGNNLIERSDGLVIPTNEANSDYQAYLESLKDAAN